MLLRNRIAPTAAALLFAVLAWGADSRLAVEQPPTGELTRVEVTKAVEQLRKDPDLSRERTMRMLRWSIAMTPKRRSRI
ncbi:MAG: hypothetical protein WDO56_37360 [Gammaproteobacteria bacterium]